MPGKIPGTGTKKYGGGRECMRAMIHMPPPAHADAEFTRLQRRSANMKRVSPIMASMLLVLALTPDVAWASGGHLEDKIADVIKFLASDGARFVTGQIVAVNGGKTAA